MTNEPMIKKQGGNCKKFFDPFRSFFSALSFALICTIYKKSLKNPIEKRTVAISHPPALGFVDIWILM